MRALRAADPALLPVPAHGRSCATLCSGRTCPASASCPTSCWTRIRCSPRSTCPTPEYALYQQIYTRLRPQAPTPDLVIYLQAGAETLLERIRRRKVEAERKHRRGLPAPASPTATRDSSTSTTRRRCSSSMPESLNPVDADADFELLLQRLYAMRSYREFFGYAE
ncbi:MAG: deoxynucleoside kinase [Comamonadaceae bacterium]|nr:deoxynucleoside kinase [Comamonadaceae bacterium]